MPEVLTWSATYSASFQTPSTLVYRPRVARLVSACSDAVRRYLCRGRHGFPNAIHRVWGPLPSNRGQDARDTKICSDEHTTNELRTATVLTILVRLLHACTCTALAVPRQRKSPCGITPPAPGVRWRSVPPGAAGIGWQSVPISAAQIPGKSVGTDYVGATVEKVKHPARKKSFIPSGVRSYVILRPCARTEFRHDSCNAAH